MTEREWASFIEMNDFPETTAITLWETAKVYIRGKLTHTQAVKRKAKQNYNKKEIQFYEKTKKTM